MNTTQTKAVQTVLRDGASGKRTIGSRRRQRAWRKLAWPLASGPLLWAMLATLPIGSPTAHADTEAAQPTLETTEIRAGMYRIRAEIADSESERERGLMYRESLAVNSGMLFVFDNRRAYCFWMRNTPLPLSIAFIADDGTIVNIADMQPRSDDSHCAEQRVRFALEMPQGWFEQKGIKAGNRLVSERYFKP